MLLILHSLDIVGLGLELLGIVVISVPIINMYRSTLMMAKLRANVQNEELVDIVIKYEKERVLWPSTREAFFLIAGVFLNISGVALKFFHSLIHKMHSL